MRLFNFLIGIFCLGTSFYSLSTDHYVFLLSFLGIVLGVGNIACAFQK